MSQEQWSRVDGYIVERLIGSDEALGAALASNAAAGLPEHDVSAPQGMLLHLMARMIGARRILEIGTLGGYSTIWLARALATDGRVVTLEADPGHADVARRNIERAGLAERVDIRAGPALETLAQIAASGSDLFDLVFIDADKQSYPDYLAWALRLSRPGGVIVADNVVRGGAILDSESADPRVRDVRRFFDALGAEPRLQATAIQTVGAKGWDGLVIAVVE